MTNVAFVAIAAGLIHEAEHLDAQDRKHAGHQVQHHPPEKRQEQGTQQTRARARDRS
jgi:hypothetical protein